jgi:hypothetical protein
MEKISVKLSQLERIDQPKSSKPKDLMTEQMCSATSNGGYAHYYKCPCGNGEVVDDKDATSGFKNHEILIMCSECNDKYVISR